LEAELLLPAIRNELIPGPQGRQVDETFIGGKSCNMHADERARSITGTGEKDKTAVIGILERGRKVLTSVIPNRRKKALQAEVRKHIASGAAIFTDALETYEGLASDYAYQVMHYAVAYVDFTIHTNTLVDFWSLWKCGIKGAYDSVELFHLFRYLDEQAFRYDNREATEADCFNIAQTGILG
jgi:hypothetical protein